MSRIAVLLFLAFLLIGCETGHVIEITMPLSQTASSSTPARAVRDCLETVAKELGMRIEGPFRGPGEDVQYTAKYLNEAVISGFFISVKISDRVSIAFRSISDQVDPVLAERAFDLFRVEFDERGLSYNVRRN